MNEIFEKDVAVDGPVVNEGERSSSTFSTGQGPLVGSLERGQRWTVRRKQEAVLRLLRGESVELLSLKERKGDPLQAELDTAMKRIGELTMQVELLEAKMEKSVPLARRRSRQ